VLPACSDGSACAPLARQTAVRKAGIARLSHTLTILTEAYGIQGGCPLPSSPRLEPFCCFHLSAAEWSARSGASRNRPGSDGRFPGIFPDRCSPSAPSSAKCRSKCRSQIRCKRQRPMTEPVAPPWWTGVHSRVFTPLGEQLNCFYLFCQPDDMREERFRLSARSNLVRNDGRPLIFLKVEPAALRTCPKPGAVISAKGILFEQFVKFSKFEVAN
jgi:hypothetical protein